MKVKALSNSYNQILIEIFKTYFYPIPQVLTLKNIIKLLYPHTMYMYTNEVIYQDTCTWRVLPFMFFKT